MLEICLMKPHSKNGENNEPKNHGEPNFPKIPVLNEYGIIGGAFLLTPQEDHINMPHDKTPGKTGENNEITSTKIKIHSKCQSLMNMELLVVHFFYHPNNIMEICLKIKSLEKLGKTMNLTNMGIPIHSRCQYLFNMMFLVTNFFYYINNIATISGSVLLQWLMTM